MFMIPITYWIAIVFRITMGLDLVERVTMSQTKVKTLPDAIREFVHDGSSVSIEGFTHIIPYAAAHEIIRQKKRHLTVYRMTADIVVDQLIAGDCVDSLTSSFIGNSSVGSLHELRRRIEGRGRAPLEYHEYSHGGMIARYLAGASGLPFYPVLSYAGSDLPKVNEDIRVMESPYDGQKVYVVPPINADVAILHAQRADTKGNVQIWGLTGIQQEVAYSANKVIVTVEELVEDDVITSDPNRTLLPSHVVDAVVEVPKGAHPSFVQGYYDRDGDFYRQWNDISKDPETLEKWLQEWVHELGGHQDYVDKQGREFWGQLESPYVPSLPVNYGSRRA
ncbi:3-oxoadipate CoA-transferase subunit A [Corynebacterium occultum]|uniref:3-oxoadipate CoA-transferase subunit A n=2 Tax=Corynebacterium occultum TaxID=2675219 RepID=A0A6B8W2C7_9CORY|nr:3-oxoadipate CoA-transferase subunit A [Corynebacterium occultum]